MPVDPASNASGSGGDPFARLADKAERDLADAVYRLLSGLPDTAWARKLRKAIKAGDWTTVNEQLLTAPYSPDAYRALAEAVAKALDSGAALETDSLPPLTGGLSPDVQVFLPSDILPRPPGLNLANPAALRFVSRYTFDLVRGLADAPTSPTKQTLSVVIGEGLRQGHGPRRIADAVDAVLGLAPAQARAVQSFRAQLENWGDKRDPGDWGLGSAPSRAPGGAQVAPVDARGRLTDEARQFRLRDFRQDGFLLRALQAGEQQRAHRANRSAFMEREITAAMQRGKSASEARKAAEQKFAAIDAKLGSARHLPPEKINQMVEAYARRWLKQRAQMVARTESIRALNAGKYMQWRSSIEDGSVDGSLVYKRWIVAKDERTCPTCNGLARHYNAMNNGWGIQLDQYFDPSTLAGFRLGRSQMQPVLYPPLHPACFTPDALVTAGFGIRAISKRPYQGDVVIVRTAGDVRLSVTPNHPVLTRRGWVPAGEIREGDQLIDQAIARLASTEAANLNKHYVPARFAEMFDLAQISKLSPAASKQPVSTTDFHGDGWHGDVDIVSTDGHLLSDVDTSGAEPVSDQSFVGRNALAAARLGRFRNFPAMFFTLFHAAYGIMRRGCQCEALLSGSFAHAGVHSGAPIPRGDPVFDEDFANPLPLHAISSRQRLLAFIGLIGGNDIDNRHRGAICHANNAKRFRSGPQHTGRYQPSAQGPLAGAGLSSGLFDRFPQDIDADRALSQLIGILRHDNSIGPLVSGIDRSTYKGDVYNAETYAGFYAVNGIVVHNCRCTMLPRLLTRHMLAVAA